VSVGKFKWIKPLDGSRFVGMLEERDGYNDGILEGWKAKGWIEFVEPAEPEALEEQTEDKAVHDSPVDRALKGKKGK
jgi:hypothetical protein